MLNKLGFSALVVFAACPVLAAEKKQPQDDDDTTLIIRLGGFYSNSHSSMNVTVPEER